MSRVLTDGEVKALFSEAVAGVGGQEAAALRLGISRQRVQQLTSPNCPDMPTFRQIMTVECILERSIICGAQVRAVEGEALAPINGAVVEAVTDAAAVLRLVTDMDGDGRRDAAEIQSVRRAAQANLQAAERLSDAAAQLQPGRVA